MSRTVNLVLRVDSEGYEVARKRMQAVRDEGPQVEQAMDRLAKRSVKASATQADAAEKAAKRAAEAAEKQYERDFAALVKKEEREAALAAKAADRKKAADDKAAEAAKRRYEADFAALVKKEAREKEAADRKAQIAARAAQRENELWNDQIQKAKARYDREVEAAERAAKRKADLAERSAQRESEAWNNAIQRAKARAEREGWGKDGVLPIRPSLQRIEAKINQPAGGLAAIGGTELASAAAGLVGFAAAAAAVRKVIGETAEYDGLIARLTGVAGSTEAARAQFDKLEELSDATIYSENEVTEAFLRLDQAGIKPTEKTLKAFANIASATGSSMQDLADVSMQAALGNFRGLLQLGIKAEADGEKLKLTFKGITTTVTNSSEEIVKYLTSIGENDFAGAAARQLDTMGGSVKKLEDAWGDLFREIGRNAIGEFIATGMRTAADAINGVSSAVEALFFTMSKRPKFTGMSAGLSEWVKGATGYSPDGTTDAEKEQESKIREILAGIEKGSISQADKDLQDYLDKRATLLDALAGGYSFSGAALDDLDRQYAAKVNSGKAGGAGKDREYVLRSADQDAELQYMEMLKKQEDEAKKSAEREYQAVKDSLTREEDKTEASYKKRAEILQRYTTVEAAQYLLENESLWDKHNAELAEKERKAEAEKAKLRAGLMPGSTNPFDQLRSEEEEKLQIIEDARLTDLEHTREYEAAKFAVIAEYARKNQELGLQVTQQSAQNAAAMFGSLAEAAKNWGGEQSGIYKAMFATQKAFAIASATTSMAVGIGKAMELGWPAGIPAAIQAASEGARVMAMISSSNYSGAYDAGGYIPAGSVGLVGERRMELIDRPTMVRGPARVIGGAETERIMGGNGRPQINITVLNAPEGRANAYRASSAREQVVVSDTRRARGAMQRVLGG